MQGSGFSHSSGADPSTARVGVIICSADKWALTRRVSLSVDPYASTETLPVMADNQHYTGEHLSSPPLRSLTEALTWMDSCAAEAQAHCSSCTFILSVYSKGANVPAIEIRCTSIDLWPVLREGLIATLARLLTSGIVVILHLSISVAGAHKDVHNGLCQVLHHEEL